MGHSTFTSLTSPATNSDSKYRLTVLPTAATAYYPTFNFTTLSTKAAWDCISKNITAKPRTTDYPRINSTTAAETLEYFMYVSTVKPTATT